MSCIVESVLRFVYPNRPLQSCSLCGIRCFSDVCGGFWFYGLQKYYSVLLQYFKMEQCGSRSEAALKIIFCFN